MVFNSNQKLLAYHLTPWDPEGLPPGTLKAYPLTPCNPNQLADLSSPVWSCYFRNIWPALLFHVLWQFVLSVISSESQKKA